MKKTMTQKQRVFALLTAAPLLLTLLITSCAGGADNQGAIPPGYGAIQLNLGEKVKARTILPDPSIDDFLSFKVKIEGTTAASVSYDETAFISAADVTKIILVPLGTNYTVTVTGYLDDIPGSGDPEKDAAMGSETGVGITSGDVTSVSIELVPYDPATAISGDEGKFAYNITYNSDLGANAGDLNTATFSIFESDGSTLVSGPTNIKGTAGTGSIDLDPGYYFVVFSLEHKDGSSIAWRHALHVYKNLTSTFPFEFEKAYFIGGGLLLDLTLATIDNAAFDLKAAGVEVTGDVVLTATGTPTIAITVNSLVLTNVKWYSVLNGAEISTATPGTFIATTDTNVAVQATADKYFAIPGKYIIAVTGESGSNTYSTYFTINVQ